jgi:uroporphyrinogen decarboxylase
LKSLRSDSKPELAFVARAADALVCVVVLGSKEIEEEPLSDAFPDGVTIAADSPLTKREAGLCRPACACQSIGLSVVLAAGGRYMPEYMAVRKHHSLLEICRTPEVAAEVTITAAGA